MSDTMRQWLLTGHPRGRPIADNDLKLVEAPIPSPGDGEVLLKVTHLGFDPAQKGGMESVAGCVAPMQIGDVMRGSGIGEVVQANRPDYGVGDVLVGMTGWNEYTALNPETMERPVDGLSPTTMLGPLGTTGMTAYCGLFKLGKPVAGETVVVSGAAGATGSIVGQLAKIAGCKTIGIAGGPEKCAWLTEEVGYDAAIDYKEGSVRTQLKEAAPKGVDVIFDNVGGAILNDMLGQIATGARVVICGGISRYETGSLPAGPQNYFNLVFRRASMHGFIVLDWASEFPIIRKRLAEFVKDGRLAYREDIQSGFENAPATLQRLFSGQNKGKQLLAL
ncbi:MAG: NADP-dependent oxidoreductase [Sphingomonadales bacterium]